MWRNHDDVAQSRRCGAIAIAIAIASRATTSRHGLCEASSSGSLERLELALVDAAGFENEAISRVDGEKN